MRLAAGSLLLLAGCLTPMEAKTLVDDDRTSYIEDARKAVLPDIERAVESGDDAVRGEVEEAFHTAKDARIGLESKNDGQHAILRGAIDEQTKKINGLRDVLNEATGYRDGADKAITAALGADRTRLLDAMSLVRELKKQNQTLENRLDGVQESNEKAIRDLVFEWIMYIGGALLALAAAVTTVSKGLAWAKEKKA